jgi:hypothetical protein
MAIQKAILFAGVGLTASIWTLTAAANNPLITHMYTADPAVHVWPNSDRLWLYATHDEPDAKDHATVDYHVFSTDDLITWVDHGRVLHLNQVSWASANMWAVDAVLWKGTYYLVYCAKQKGSGVYRTGLATSSRPEGPFTDIGYVKGVDWGQDPAVFVENGKAYLYWGSGAKAYVGVLADDLKSLVPGTTRTLTAELTNVYEGPWLHKYSDAYYLTYPGLVDAKWPELMFYATSKSPLGPFTYQGQYMGKFDGMAGTNHGSFVEYKGQWLAFYHTAWMSGGNGYRRNIHAEFASYGEKGELLPITPTQDGVWLEGQSAQPSRSILQLEAENGAAAGGELIGVKPGTTRAGYSGAGYVTAVRAGEDRVSFHAHVNRKLVWTVKLRYASSGGAVVALYQQGQFYGLDTLPASSGFSDVELGTLALEAGANTLTLRLRSGQVDWDRLVLEPSTKQPDSALSEPSWPVAGTGGSTSSGGTAGGTSGGTGGSTSPTVSNGAGRSGNEAGGPAAGTDAGVGGQRRNESSSGCSIAEAAGGAARAVPWIGSALLALALRKRRKRA